MNSERKYVQPQPISREDASNALQSDDPLVIGDALVRLAFHDPNREFVEEACRAALRNANEDLVRCAINSFCYITAFHGVLSRESFSLLTEFSKTSGPLAEHARDAVEEIALRISHSVPGQRPAPLSDSK